MTPSKISDGLKLKQSKFGIKSLYFIKKLFKNLHHFFQISFKIFILGKIRGKIYGFVGANLTFISWSEAK